jgi:LysR family glycine cleavage system transcriptional activator
MKSLPPLGALRVFEAAARHLSVKDAAQELCVTPGAVSQMLKVLESHLGVALFQRVNRGIVLTAAGQSYLPPVRGALRQIAQASARLARHADGGALTVSVTPFFAAAWLVPRLPSLQQAHPDIDVHVASGTALVNWARDAVDIAVRHGSGRYPGLRSELLLAVDVVPVAAPALVDRLGMPSGAADLAQWPRVHDAERAGWQQWFLAQGVDSAGPARGTAFTDSALLLQAVLAGQGAGLLPTAMVQPDIAAGRLVAVGPAALLGDFAYYLVYPEEHLLRPSVAAFRAWVLAEAGR